MTIAQPTISAVVCTRNRGASVVAAVQSILANDHLCFELIVIDQSINTVTAEALETLAHDPRLRYITVNQIGVSAARNTGLRLARAPLVAFTDDDCTVQPNWLRVLEAEFVAHPRVAMLFCNVLPAAHNIMSGFIPHYDSTNTLVRTVWGKLRARGIGAGMALRRNIALTLKGFDEQLGPGARFPACEEGDLAVRILLNGYWVFETAATSVIHDGFRTWEEGRELTRRDWNGIGAAYVKPLKCGWLTVLPLVIYEGVVMAMFVPLSSILRLKIPHGLRRAMYFWQGFWQGLRTPVDPQTLLYKPFNNNEPHK